MKRLCVALPLMMVIYAPYADIYKWVDSQGNVHFTDTPFSGARKLNIPDAQVYSSPVPEPIASEKLRSKYSMKNKIIYKIVIVQPDNEATIRNNQGAIAITVRVEPDLLSGDQVQIIFDGRPWGKPQANLLFLFSNIDRGVHTIAAQIMNNGGEVLKLSEPITIYMFRPRVNKKSIS